jgi:Lar family restriction alleviation protein
MSTEIQPCPFCGHEDVEIDEVDHNCFAVCCPECETIGPIKRTTVEEAITAWNNRIPEIK